MRPKKRSTDRRGVLLEEQPFTFRERGDGSVAIFWKGRHATVLSGKLAENFLARRAREHGPGAAAADGERDRQLQAGEREEAMSESGNGSGRVADGEGLQVRPGGALVPGLRRLRDPRRRPGLHARARSEAREDRLRLRDRLRCALPVLHGDLRDALDPRPRAGDRDRAVRVPARPVRVGRDRGRRLDVDRRQPPDPRAAPEREPEDPDVQQQDLRADEGPVLADERAGQGDEVDADGVVGSPVQPALAGDRRRGDASSRARSTPTRRS